MKKLILIALVCSALYSSATGYFGVKPIVNEPTCYGQNNGSITLSVLGGTPPFTYQWSGGLPATNVINNVAAGTYYVTVTDANGLIANYAVVIGQPYAISIYTGSVNVGTHGGNNGSVTATPDGGTPGYTYDWSNGATTQSITGLPSGTYTVTVTDAVGCSSSTSQVVTQPAHPAVNRIMPSQNEAKSLDVTGGTDASSAKASNTDELAKPSATSLKSEDVQVYPNPATNVLTLKTGDVSNAQITVFDINGQKVTEQIAESTETTLNVSSLPAGNYIVEIKSADGTVVNRKVAVTK